MDHHNADRSGNHNVGNPLAGRPSGNRRVRPLRRKTRRPQVGPKRSETWVPVRPITRGPAYHWFGYYDKLQFDPSGRYVLGMEVTFEDRSPKPDDVIKVGMIDLQDNDRWIELGETRAWNWQQGCMLQWRPGSDREVVWNDREGDRFVCRIMDVKTRATRTIPHPVYTLSPDGRWAMAPDFRRINDMRPGYGYAGLPDPNSAAKAPTNAGIWKVDLQTGQATLIIPFAEMLTDSLSGRRYHRQEALVQPPPVQPRWFPFHFPQPLANQGVSRLKSDQSVQHPHDDGDARRQGYPGGR